jgi:hypothetical protein
MNKIAIIVPYFGEWPAWFRVFLKTCSCNKEVNWIFFTDCERPKNAPENVKFNKMTINEFEKTSSKKTKVKTKIKNAYKVCDFKPAFGKIFEDHLEEYDFWGWGDIDVIYGDLKNIFTPYRLNKYDIISTRRYGTSGVLSVLRNTESMKNMYKESPDYKRVFRSKVGYAFDETGKFFEDRRVVGFTDVIKNSSVKYHFWDYTETDKKIDKKELDMYWEKGKLYDMRYGEEISMYHFLDRKKETDFGAPFDEEKVERFSVRKEGMRKEASPRKIVKKPIKLAKKRTRNAIRWTKDTIKYMLKRGR